MALISVVQTEMVERRKLMSSADMLDGISLASVLPGPVAVNVVAYVGYRLRGGAGALVSAAGVILPGFALMVALSAAYFRWGEIPAANKLFLGFVPAVTAIIVNAAWGMARKTLVRVPELLFAAAYADYARGNYDLALSEFKQYVETYPTSEMADNAQYWIGEILYAQKKLPEASAAFEQVKVVSPNGDKTPAALYKRAMVLMDMGRRDEAVVQLLEVYKDYSKTREADLAHQKLMEVAPEALNTATPNRTPPRTPSRRP